MFQRNNFLFNFSKKSPNKPYKCYISLPLSMSSLKATSSIWRINNIISQKYFQQMTIQRKILGWQIHPANETSHIEANPTIILTLPLRILWFSPMVHALIPAQAQLFCATEWSRVTHRMSCRLDDNNSIFKVKLFAIFKALKWISQQNVNYLIPIFSDSLQRLQANYEFESTNPQVIEIK